MKTRILAAPALALLIGSCTVDNNASLAWGPICAPSDNCSFDGTCGAENLAPYEVNPGAASALRIFVQMDNQRTNTGDESTGNANTATAYIRELVFEYSNGLPTASVPVAYQAPAEGSTVVFADIPLPGVAAGQRVIVRIQARGVYGDESEFETAFLEVPINVCDTSTCLLAKGTCATGVGCPVAGGQSPIVCGS